MGHHHHNYFGTGLVGSPNQEKQNHNGLGPHTQLAVGLDRNWMVGRFVPGRKKIKDKK
jgi:hypothetical protein